MIAVSNMVQPWTLPEALYREQYSPQTQQGDVARAPNHDHDQQLRTLRLQDGLSLYRQVQD